MPIPGNVTIYFKFGGADGSLHPYLVVKGLRIEQLNEKSGQILFFAETYDDGQNIPNARSQEAIRGIEKSFIPYVKNRTLDSFERRHVYNLYEMDFTLKPGTNFIDRAVELGVLVIRLFGISVSWANPPIISIRRQDLVNAQATLDKQVRETLQVHLDKKIIS